MCLQLNQLACLLIASKNENQSLQQICYKHSYIACIKWVLLISKHYIHVFGKFVIICPLSSSLINSASIWLYTSYKEFVTYFVQVIPPLKSTASVSRIKFLKSWVQATQPFPIAVHSYCSWSRSGVLMWTPVTFIVHNQSN